jgi:hypothetical protein
MARFPVLRLRAAIPVGFDEDEAGGIILLLEAIEAGDARFAPAFRALAIVACLKASTHSGLTWT